MKILGIDTTTKFLSLGLLDNGKIYEYNLELGRRHSSLLTVTIKRVLDALGWGISGINYFACGLGPGSFTGIRVGLATINGLAWSLHKPVIGVSTLDILAGNIDISGRPIVPVIDAKRGLVYCSVYKTKDGTHKRIRPYMLLTQNQFIRKVPSQALIFGDAVDLHKENMLRDIKGATILEKDYWYPRGSKIVALALERIRSNKFSRFFSANPIYLYPKECQIRKASV